MRVLRLWHADRRFSGPLITSGRRRMESISSSSAMPQYLAWGRTMGKAMTGKLAVLLDSYPRSSLLHICPIARTSKKHLLYSRGYFAGKTSYLVGSWLSSQITGLWSSSTPRDPCHFGRPNGMSTSQGLITPSSMSKDSRMWSQMLCLECMRGSE